jgi:PTS system mannose-specific IIC component
VSHLEWGLLVWGTVVGLDLVSFPQMMLARPLVAGAGAGLILGDVGAGLRIGVVFELFQYDILPVGATRYPEYGPATVVAVAAVHAFALPFGIGLSTVVGLFTALLGGTSLQILRRLNTRAVAAAASRLEAGDRSVLYRLHFGGAGRDLLRAAAVTAAGLALVAITQVFVLPALSHRGERLLSVAATGAALAAGAAGTVRLVGLGPPLKWLAAGLAGGIVVAWLT